MTESENETVKFLPLEVKSNYTCIELSLSNLIFY